MRVQQVPNSPYFIHYDDDGYCCISKSKESQESIPESEMQEFLDAVANGLLYIEKERKSRYQRIEEAKKAALAFIPLDNVIGIKLPSGIVYP